MSKDELTVQEEMDRLEQEEVENLVRLEQLYQETITAVFEMCEQIELYEDEHLCSGCNEPCSSGLCKQCRAEYRIEKEE